MHADERSQKYADDLSQMFSRRFTQMNADVFYNFVTILFPFEDPSLIVTLYELTSYKLRIR